MTCATARLTSLLGSTEADRGVLVLGEKANVQGVVDVGLHPGLLPGHRKARDETARRELQAHWGGEVPPGPGWLTKETLSHAAWGNVEVLHIVGQDPVAAWPQGFGARMAIEGAGFVVVQDAFLTQTARLADVVLPVRILGDREGTLVGADGVRRSLGQVRTAPRREGEKTTGREEVPSLRDGVVLPGCAVFRYCALLRAEADQADSRKHEGDDRGSRQQVGIEEDRGVVHRVEKPRDEPRSR